MTFKAYRSGELSTTTGGAVSIAALLPTLMHPAINSAAGRRARPTGSKVRANSPMYVGEEGDWFQRRTKNELQRGFARLRALEQTARQKAKVDRTRAKNGVVGHVGIEIYGYLVGTINRITGRLDPAIATIARAIGRSIEAVNNGLKALRHVGFLDWRRRIEPTGEPGLRGPQVKQSTNAYRLIDPVQLDEDATAPLPVDEADRRQQDAAERERMEADQAEIDRDHETALAALSPYEQIYVVGRARPGDNPLLDAIAKMASGQRT